MRDDTDKTDKRCETQQNPSSSSDPSDSGIPLDATKEEFIVQNGADISNDEDEEIGQNASKRKCLRILSDYESEESHDEDGGDFSDSSRNSSGNSSENEEGDENQPLPFTENDKLEQSSGSESDGQSDKCPICLVKFTSQELGTPEACDHLFCADCIQEWAKNVNTCPVDRQQFSLILVRESIDGKVIRQIPVTPTEIIDVPDEDVTFCEVCGLGDREDRMLLCDSCDHGYHMECLQPPMVAVPIDEWHCPECDPLYRHRQLNQAMERIAQSLGAGSGSQLEPWEDGWAPPAPPRTRRNRLLPRTRQSERVRRTLTNLRNQMQALRNSRQPSTSSGRESVEGGQRQRRQRTATNTRRRKTKRKPSFRIKKIETEDGVVEVLVKIKRKKYRKKRKYRTVRSTPRTTKERLANRLGMCKPRMAKQMIPETTNKQEVTSAPINHQRHQAGIPTLDIFGRRDQLDYFSGSDAEDEGGSMEGGVGLLSRARVARPHDNLLIRKKAATVLSLPSVRKSSKVENITPPASGNLLDSILDSQTLWHSKQTDIKSKSDGSLQVILKNSKNGSFKSESKIDVRTATASANATPMFPNGGGNTNSGAYDANSSPSEGNSQSNNTGSSEQSGGSTGFQSSASRNGGFSRSESSVGEVSAPGPLRGVAPIRFRMNIPPRKPNIHSYPSDNIPPPPPLRLRPPMVEMSFPVINSPDASPARDEDDVDIYSDIEQQVTNSEAEEKTFGALEPPPEPPFLMMMEPPPEPPALLMSLNDDPSDDEATGLVIDDLPSSDVYDPCAVNSDDSSTGDTPLQKPPEIPVALKNAELVADYSSDSTPAETHSYNPELPTYQSTPIIGPLPRPQSHHSSEAEDNEEECPNFSMYSATSMNIAQRGSAVLDIPIPPSTKPDISDIDIPLPDSPKPKADICIPIPDDKESDFQLEKDEGRIDDAIEVSDEDLEDFDNKDVSDVTKTVPNKEKEQSDDDDEEEEDKKSACSDVDEEGDGDDEAEDDEDEDKEDNNLDDNKSEGNKSESQDSSDKVIRSKKTKASSETAEDECSTQGDVLDLAIESEANLENNITNSENKEQHEITVPQSPQGSKECDDKADGGDKSDGLVDITDEEMSVYDGQDNGDYLDKTDEHILESGHSPKDTDDDNSLIGGATSAVSAGTLNNSDNVQTSTLPGLEGLETETISESEDVNFDEMPLESSEQPEIIGCEEDLSVSRKKRKKKNRKISHIEDSSSKTGNEVLEFEEGEIVEDKPKQATKKDKKSKSKPDSVVEMDENETNKAAKISSIEKEPSEKKTKKKKEKNSTKDKNKDMKEKTVKVGEVDENISWKKLSRSTKDRNYRDGKEKDDKEKDIENREEGLSRKDKRSKERRKELERYDVRRLISEKPKRPKKDEFGRDISPSKSGSSLSPYRPPRYRSPLRTRNRTRSRSKSIKSRSRSRGRRRRSRSKVRGRSRDRSRRGRSRERSKRRSRSRNKISSRSRDRRRTPEKNKRRSLSRPRRRTRSPSNHSKRRHSLSYSRSWTPSWSKSSPSRSRSPRGRRRSRSHSRSKSKSWTRDQNVASTRGTRGKDPPKNLTVIVTNKEAMKKKERKKPTKKKDDRRKKKRGQSPAPSKEVFTSGDNILVSVNFKNANKNPELIPATTPLLRESSKRKRDDVEMSSKKKKTTNTSKKNSGSRKSNRLNKINEAARNSKPVAIIDLDLSPFREQTLSPKEVIVLTDSENEGEKQREDMNSDINNRLSRNEMTQSMMSLSSLDHSQKNALPQPGSPLSPNFLLNTSGPKTPPEPHIKFSISTKPSQIRMLSNPLLEAEEEMQDENVDSGISEIVHKGPNTPPDPPPDLNTPASPPTTPYDPFDPTKSRSPSPQPRISDTGSQLNSSREDKLDNIQNDDENGPRLSERGSTTPQNESEDLGKTPEPAKGSTPKTDHNTDISPKHSPPISASDTNKVAEDSLLKSNQKVIPGANKLDVHVNVHKSPDKIITVVINQQNKSLNQTPKQAIQPLKTITPIKHQTPKGNVKHQLFSSSLIKQVPLLGSLPLFSGAPSYTPSVGINSSANKLSARIQQNGDPSDDMDIDPSSPYSPGSSEGDDLFEPPVASPPRNSKSFTNKKPTPGGKFDALFGSSPAKARHGRHSSKLAKKGAKSKSKGSSKKEEVKVKLDEDQLKILDELPSSAVEMQFLKKLNRQERVVEEVKLVLKPHYTKKHINKEEYKEILRRSVPKICHNKSGEINPIKIQFLIEAYVKKFRYSKKKASGPPPAITQNKPKPQKTLWS